jgi:hypothetical protein
VSLIAELYEVGHSVGAVCLAGYIHHMPDLLATTQGFHHSTVCMEKIPVTVIIHTPHTPEQYILPT